MSPVSWLIVIEASTARAAVVRTGFARSLAEDRIAALRAPASPDLGAETAEEVALSNLAELVHGRHGRAAFARSGLVRCDAGIIRGCIPRGVTGQAGAASPATTGGR